MLIINNKLIVEYVPNESYDFKLTRFKEHTVLDYKTIIKGTIGSVGINDGEFNVILNNAKILGKLSELSEEVCSRFTEQQWGDKHKDYIKVGHQNNPFMFKTAKESLISLLESHGVDTSKNLLLIEKL